MLALVPNIPFAGDYVPVRSFPYTLAQGGPDDLGEVRALYRESATWLGRDKQTDQWSRPWPDPGRHRQHMEDDLLKGRTWLVWDRPTVAATITLDTSEPLTASGGPVWPTHKRHETALYVRRVIVRRCYAGLGIGAALLDWGAEAAMRKHRAALIRVNVWTTNSDLHTYYKQQHFTRCRGRDPAELIDYPAQVLFERELEQAGKAHIGLVVEAVGERVLSAVDAFRPAPLQLARA
jgi:GNAT superfamily N-acetyltransferase